MVLSMARCPCMLLPDQIDPSFLMEVLEAGRRQDGDVDKRFAGLQGRNGIEVDYEIGKFYVSYQVRD